MGDIGVPELLVILVIVVLIFGPSRLTDVMGALGKGIREFRSASSGQASTSATPEHAPRETDSGKDANAS
jgi:sec-independent protein translocase protein TatA